MGKALKSVMLARLSKRIVETGKHRGTFTAIADVDIPHHRGPGDATEGHAADLVKPIDRKITRSAEHLGYVHERRHLEVDVRRFRVESPDRMTHLRAAGEFIAVVEPPGAETAQRLLAADVALVAPDAAERPERQARHTGHVTYRHVGRHDSVRPDRPVKARVAPGLAIEGLVEDAAAAGGTSVDDNPHTLPRHGEIVPRVVDHGVAIQQLAVG